MRHFWNKWERGKLDAEGGSTKQQTPDKTQRLTTEERRLNTSSEGTAAPAKQSVCRPETAQKTRGKGMK